MTPSEEYSASDSDKAIFPHPSYTHPIHSFIISHPIKEEIGVMVSHLVILAYLLVGSIKMQHSIIKVIKLLPNSK